MKPKTIRFAPPLPDADAFATKQQPAAGGMILFTSGAAKTDGAIANAFCRSQTPAAAGELTVNGELACTLLPVPRVVTIQSAANLSAQTYTIRGIGTDNRYQTDGIAGPNNSTVRSTKIFSAVLQVHTSGAAAGAVQVGAQAYGNPSEACRVVLTASQNESAGTFNLYGLDRQGRYITESGTLPNAAALTSNRTYSKVIGLDVSSKTASIIQLGTATKAESQWIPVEKYSARTFVGVALSTSADCKYNVQFTNYDINSTDFGPTKQLASGVSPYVHNATDISATTVSAIVSINLPVSAVRVAFAGFASGYADIMVNQERQSG